VAGELTIKDWTARNALNTNLQPYRCVDLDVTNSNASDTCVGPPSGALSEVIGIVYDKSRLDPTGAVIKNSGVTIKSFGFCRVEASAAIAAGAYVSCANTTGQIQAQAQAAAGAQPKAIVGRALTSAGVILERPLVFLMIGSRY
jgi:hypothetical protein